MRLIKTLSTIVCVLALVAGSAFGAEKVKTCCEGAKADGKECKHKCCVAAHKEGKSCVKCNPDKQDLKKDKKTAVKDQDAAK